jgi:hypothetical protein
MSKARTRRTAARLQRLFSGDYAREEPGMPPAPAGTTAELLLLPGAPADAADALGPESLVVAPSGTRLRGPAELVTYEGGLGPDEELLLSGGLVLAAQPYTTAAFTPLTCPTVLRITDAQDLESFVEDADAAVETGAFPDAVLHPLSILGDVCALGTEHICAAPRRSRVVVAEDGVARPALGGEALDDATARDSACLACLGAVVAADDLDAARAARPWLSRYLRVADVLRALGGRLGAPPAVSGFGTRFADSLPAEPVEPADAPVLVRDGDEHLVCDPDSRRVLRTGADAARILEVLLAGVDRADPVEAVAHHLDLEHARAAYAVDEVGRTLERLGFPLRVREAA